VAAGVDAKLAESLEDKVLRCKRVTLTNGSYCRPGRRDFGSECNVSREVCWMCLCQSALGSVVLILKSLNVLRHGDT
jgi:hypothetical protein